MSFIRQAERLLSKDERDDIITFPSRKPRAGVPIRGTGASVLVEKLSSIWIRKRR
jgi:hypothetical protein